MEYNPHPTQQQTFGTEQQYYQQQPQQGVVPEKGAAPYQNGEYQHQTDTYGSQYPPVVPAPAAEPAATHGVKRSIFFAVIGVAALLAALVIGLGAGLGVTQNKLHDAESDLSAALARVTSAPSQTTVFVTRTVSATQTPSATTVPTVDCPASNNTIYISSEGDKQFNRFCGIDYAGDGADDLASVETVSMEACIDACASESECQGCGWGILDTTKSVQSCWLKTNLTSSHSATPEWGFAVLASLS